MTKTCVQYRCSKCKRRLNVPLTTPSKELDKFYEAGWRFVAQGKAVCSECLKEREG